MPLGRQPDRDKPLLTMLFRHGLRLSEAIDRRWPDFDLESKQRTLFVRRLKGSRTRCTLWSLIPSVC
jgi:type 1 fimbriae regulatory protein FimB